jgi:2-polyprenyl-3-methyl-5-hydroxy-6-metoxy-1,4-benzoquinol methylase
MDTFDATTKRMRLLVAIASFGEKNLGFLKQVIAAYRKMPFSVDVVVLSNAPKDLGPDVKVLVGLPIANPWSLPFAHKPVFAENADAYDLFIYSEDDMAVSLENIQAFLRVTPQLAPDEIAGYLRYEVDPAGNWSLPEVHGAFHWKPETAHQCGALTVAEFSNEHAAFYLLNQAQLKKCIASGGFLVAPYEGRHDMLCAAATDPYSNCGFRKMVCISELESFCIHHLPNRYIGEYGLPLDAVKQQMQTLQKIVQHAHPVSTLCEVESKLQRRKWSKGFYDLPGEELLGAIPVNAKTILSIGCGWGATEAKLRDRGAVVTALPLDSVIGADAARLGVHVIYDTLEGGFGQLETKAFDCVIITNLLHLLPSPEETIKRMVQLVGAGGSLVISGPNFEWFRIVGKRLFKKEDCEKLRNYEESGIHAQSRAAIVHQVKRHGLTRVQARWYNHSAPHRTKSLPAWTGRFTAKEWLIQAGKDR